MRDYERFIGKELPEVLTELKGEGYDIVKIGCDGGSSFLYIADTDRFELPKGAESPKQVKAIVELEKAFFIVKENQVKLSTKNYETHVRQYPTPSKYIMAQDKRGDGFSYQGFCNVLDDWFKATYKKRLRLNRLGEEFKNRLPIFERTVKEAYEGVEDGTIILLIDGTEVGKYWTKEEWAKAHPTGEILNEVEIETSDGEGGDEE